MTDNEGMEKIKKETEALYRKARTKEEYEKAIEAGRSHEEMLEKDGKTSDEIVSVILGALWANYYLLLKFPSEFTEEDKDGFLGKIYELESVVGPSNKIELLYLESMTWSHLFNNPQEAESCIREIGRIIAEGNASIVQVLKSINARVVKEMDEKNYSGAIQIADEIKQFSEEALVEPENIGAAANIINNRGASKIRGDIDVKGGITDLMTALDCYLKQTPVPMNHIEGIRNRLMGAIWRR